MSGVPAVSRLLPALTKSFARQFASKDSPDAQYEKDGPVDG